MQTSPAATSELIDYACIPDSAWSRLSRAADEPADPMRVLAMATIATDGRPCNRLMVLRGVDRPCALLWFHSDRRSPKMRHLGSTPEVSIIAYDQRDGVQLRLDGGVSVHAQDVLAQRHWEQADMLAMHTCGQPLAPGEPLRQPDPRTQAVRHEHERGNLKEARDNFVVLQVHIQTIDWLQICADEQRRAVMRAQTGWKVEPLAP